MPEASLQTEWLGQFGRGLWRYIRRSFRFGGQDSFTDPPSQNEDKFEQLLNVMPPVQGDFDRRWGYRVFNNAATAGASSATIPYPITLWSNLTSSQRALAVSTATGQSLFDESGLETYTLTYAGAPGVRSVSSRGTLYTVDGVKPQKWSNSLGNTTQNWGIDVNNVTGGPNGPNYPGTATDLGSGGTIGSSGPNNTGTGTNVTNTGLAWSNPGHIATSGTASVTFTPGGIADSDYLEASNFGFAVPSTATIKGIVLSVTYSGSTPSDIQDKTVKLLKAGAIVGSDHGTSTNFPADGSGVTITYGSATDLWGELWTYSDINATGFGAALVVHNVNLGGTVIGYVYAKPQITVYYSIPSSGSWTNPNNIKLDDGAVATATAITTCTSTLQATNFGFSISGGTGVVVNGILVEIKAKTGDNPYQLLATLLKAGTSVGVEKSMAVSGTSLGYISFGGSSDLWGTSWALADVNASNFGMQLCAETTTGTASVSIDAVRITVYTSSSSITIGAPTSTGVTLVSGRIYTYAFYNSTDQHYSDIGNFTVSTGPITNQVIPLSTIPVSLDSQVDRKKILATADGGDETVLYEIGDVLNSVTTFTDDVDEPTLLLNNQWQSVLDDGSSVGLIDNSQPPARLSYPIVHRGRMYGLVDNNLYYSKSESELLTATGVIAGRFEQAVPALNFFPVSAVAEEGRGTLSDGTVLYIGTDRRIIRLFGDGPDTYLAPQVLFDNVGIVNQDVWKLVLIEGNPVGAMWLTPDLRVMGSDFNTYQDVGTDVQDVLNSINKVAARQTAWAANVNISVFTLYVLAVPTGTNTQPDTLLVFDLKGKMWYTWKLSDTPVGGFWWVALGGTPQFLFQSSEGKLFVFDPSLFVDAVGDTGRLSGVTFTSTMRTSWLSLGDGTAYKQLNEIEIGTSEAAGAPGMTVTVEGASSISDFFNPRTVVANAPLVQKPRGPFGVFLAGGKTRDRWYRFTFNFSDTQTDLLRGWNIQGKIVNRI